MTCFEFEERLQAELDRRQSELSAESEAHAAACGACRKLREQFQQIDAAVVVWRSHLPVVDLTESVLRNLEAGQQQIRRTGTLARRMADRRQECSSHKPNDSRSGIAALFVSAIALLVMLGAGWQMSQKTLIVRQQSALRIETAVVPVRQLDVLVQDAREAYVALANQAFQHASSASFLLPPAEAVTPFRGENAVDGVPDSLSRPLSPLGHELRNTLDSFLDRVFTSQDSST